MAEETLQDFLKHEDPVIREMAQRAQSYENALEQGQISKDEYEELMQDLTDMERITAAAEDMEHKAQLEKAARALIKVLQFAGKFI